MPAKPSKRVTFKPRTGTLQGATRGERIADLIRQIGISKSAFGEMLGTDYRRVHAWTSGEKPNVSIDYLERIVEAFPVTLPELVGIADDQEPPFPAWKAFLETNEGRSATHAELQALKSVLWTVGVPTVASYQVLLAGLRMAESSGAGP